MLVRAIKSFAGRYGHIRVGQVFNGVPNYVDELLRLGLVKPVSEPAPADNRAIPAAPMRAAAPAAVGKDGATGTTERAPAGGAVRTSSSLRADLASRRKTPKPSEPGATKTPDPVTP